MTEEHTTMSQRELDRVAVVRHMVEKGLWQKDAARPLGLSVRQIKRLVRRYRAEETAGLVSRHRGERPNNWIAGALPREILGPIRSRPGLREAGRAP